jgi:hypothetical protein
MSYITAMTATTALQTASIRKFLAIRLLGPAGRIQDIYYLLTAFDDLTFVS